VRDEPVLNNTAIAGMFEHNSSVQHEEQKKLTFSQIFLFYLAICFFAHIHPERHMKRCDNKLKKILRRFMCRSWVA
jgi:hypothetical protein